MPRYYRRRYTRVVKPKKRWASNIATYNETEVNLGNDGFGYTILVQNSLQSASPTPSIIKTGNFKVSIDSIFSSTNQITGNVVVQFFVVYVPEGWGSSNFPNLIGSHPEWILASKTVGSSILTGTKLSLETVNLSSRLKRNLNSGDGIVILYSIAPSFASVATNPKLYLTGHIRYWTCAN